MKIDIREIRLRKWYMPKTNSSFEDKNDVYHAVGYFDTIEIGKAEYGDFENRHPWRIAYENSCRVADAELQSDYFVQEIKCFTNISEDREQGFQDTEIAAFWSDEDLLLCMSMLHICNDVSVQAIISRINKIFKNRRYLYYFTFDYSGIIILAKGLSIKDYLQLIFQVNYDNAEHPKMIKDTFSIYGIPKSKFKVFKDEENEVSQRETAGSDNSTYEISLNISIRNYREYEKWLKELRKFEKNHGYSSTELKLAGRHDVSVVNRKADTFWLLKTQYLLDCYTRDRNSAFYAYETFIKSEADYGYVDKADECWENYDNVTQKLDELYKKFAAAANEAVRSSYVTPVREICNSVLSILKNGFAEDFIVCMYHPFVDFLNYLLDKLEEERKTPENGLSYAQEFDRCYSSFFDGLNALVNSAMHTDRQFIQPTSFGAVFCDIPPKIMAFYVAMIRKIGAVMQKGDKNSYTFLMTPGFSDEIHVKIISYNKSRPEKRIVQIFINECFLYRPEAVMRRLVHEIAHYQGDGLRNRTLRKEKFIYTYVYTILRECLHAAFPEDEEYRNLIKRFYRTLVIQEEFAPKNNNYSKECSYLHRNILDFIVKNNMAEYLLKEYFANEVPKVLQNRSGIKFADLLEGVAENDVLSSAGISKDNLESGNLSDLQKDFLVQLLIKDTVNNIMLLRMGRFRNKENSFLQKYSMRDYARSIISLYSETYSDIQMILVLNYSYEDYLKSFLLDEAIDYHHVESSNEDISRIAAVTYLMREKGKWAKEVCLGDEFGIFNQIIEEFIVNMRKPRNKYYVQNRCLVDYLSKCFDESKKHYESEENKKVIGKIGEDIKKVLTCENIMDVYSIMSEVISECRIEWTK